MKKQIDPAIFNLPSRSLIEETSENSFTIVMEKRSRIVMKDAEKVLEKAKKIKERFPTALVGLRISGPICSKSVNFLAEHGIEVTRYKL